MLAAYGKQHPIGDMDVSFKAMIDDLKNTDVKNVD